MGPAALSVETLKNFLALVSAAKSRVLIVDDLLATGGTVKAVTDLVKSQKAVIAGVAFLVELRFLKGKDKLKDLPIYSVIKY